MADSPSRPIQSDRTSREASTRSPKMSMLAMTTPSPHPAFGRHPWEGARCSDYSLKPRAESERVALPSIRQAFPELQLQLQPHDQVSKPPSTISTTTTLAPISTSPTYVHSPNTSKRRRLSVEDEQENERARQVPRLYYSPERGPASLPPNSLPRPAPQESWTGSSRTSPYLTNGASSTPGAVEDTRSSLPSLPPPRTLERESGSMARMQAPADSYHSARGPLPYSGPPPVDVPAPSYREPNYGYTFHHPTRYQSLSAGSAQSFDRAPFAASSSYGPGPPYQEFVRYGEITPAGLNMDTKQRKRRGNLPKETTDKLRAWFVAHLQHPYPTEDEKQELMRQTGLQMNQISNWFINARRRQLPTMINNARAESDAMNGARNSEQLKVLATTERGDFEHGKRDAAGPLSDGDGAAYDEELDGLQQHRTSNISRGSV